VGSDRAPRAVGDGQLHLDRGGLVAVGGVVWDKYWLAHGAPLLMRSW
jgi:hypothetical protein